MTPTNTPAPSEAITQPSGEPVAAWTYSINYGPDGEENWANLITPEGDHVANIRTHHAMRIVAALASPSTEVERLTREVDHWIAENRRILKAGQDAAYKLADLESTIRSLKERLAEVTEAGLELVSVARAGKARTKFQGILTKLKEGQ